MNIDENGMIFRRVLRGVGNVAQTIVNGMTSVIRTGANLILNPTSVTNTLTGGASNPAPAVIFAPRPTPAQPKFPKIPKNPERYLPPPDLPFDGFPDGVLIETGNNDSWLRNAFNTIGSTIRPRLLPRPSPSRSPSGWRVL